MAGGVWGDVQVAACGAAPQTTQLLAAISEVRQAPEISPPGLIAAAWLPLKPFSFGSQTALQLALGVRVRVHRKLRG